MGFISTVFCRKRCICLVIPCIILGVVTWFAIFHRELAFLRATFNPKYQKNADETVISQNDTENHKSDFEYRDDSFREHDLFRDKNSDSDYNDDYDHGLILEHEGGHHDDQDYHGNDYHGNDHNTGLSDNDNDDGNHLGGDHDDQTHSENGNEMENDPEQERGNDNDSDDNSDHDHEHNEHLSNSDENENNSDNENDDANHSDNENSENNQSGNNDGVDNTSDNEGHSDNFHGNEHGNDGDSHSNDQNEHNNDDDGHGNEHGNDGNSHSNDQNEHNNDDDDHGNEDGNDGDSHNNDQNEHNNDDDDHGNEHGNDGDSHSNDQNQHNNDDDDADSDSFPDIFGLERSDDFIDIETENNHIIETLPDIEKHSDSMNTANDAINNILDSALDKVNKLKHPDDQENRAPPASVTPSPNGGGEALDAHMSIQKVSTNDEVMKAEQLKDQTIDVSTASIRAPSAQTTSTTMPPGKLDDKQLTIDDLISSLIDEKGDDNASTVSTTTKPHTNTQIHDAVNGIAGDTTQQPYTPNTKQDITTARIQSSTLTPSDTPLHFPIADGKQHDPNVHNLNDRHEVVDPLRDDTSEENDKKESITFEKNENNRLGSLPVTSPVIDKA